MQRWENKVVVMPVKDSALVEGKLNELGDDGWEMSRCYGTDTTTVIFFKRPKPEK